MADKPNNPGSAPMGESTPSVGATSASHANVETKVELDLDDAPFLEEDEPEPAPEPEKAPPEDQKVTPPPDESSFKERLLTGKKKILIAGGLAVVLLGAAFAVNTFFFSGGDKPPPQPLGPEPEKVLASPKPLPPAPVPNFVVQWEPFWVELKDTEGALRFLAGKFSFPTDSPILFAEMNAKKLILRDAIFYYLRNQPILSLTDNDKVQLFKKDLLSVLNEHLASGKANEVLIEDYLIQ